MAQTTIEEALSSSLNNRKKYCGNITQKEVFTILDKDGNPIHVERDVIISWHTIEKIFKMVKAEINL